MHALWTTFPVDRNPEPGVVATNTAVFAADLLFSGQRRDRPRTVFVDEFRFTYDDQGNFVPLLAINGRPAGPADFTFSIDR